MKSVILVLAIIYATIVNAAICPGGINIKTFSTTDNSNTGATVSASVDASYKLIGGGFFASVPLTQSYPSTTTTWSIVAHGIVADVGPSPVTAYAIGLYDPDNCWTVQQVVSSASDVGSITGNATAVCPQGTTLVGGGATTDRYLNNNYPDTIRGDATSAATWFSSFGSASSSFVGPSSTGITVYAMCLKPTGTGYSSGNFILNAAGSTSNAARATNRLQIVGGGFIVNGDYGTATASYNSSNAWQSNNNQSLPDTSIQSLSIGLSFSGSGSSSGSTTSPTTTTAPTTTTPTTTPKKTCVGEVITTPRSGAGGSWISGGTSYQIYDITVKNEGDCPIVRATYGSVFTGPNNPGVSQQWNVGTSPSGDQILGSVLNLFGNSIPSGGSKSGYGVVVYNATGVTNVAKGPTTFCDASCTNN